MFGGGLCFVFELHFPESHNQRLAVGYWELKSNNPNVFFTCKKRIIRIEFSILQQCDCLQTGGIFMLFILKYSLAIRIYNRCIALFA